MEVEMNNHFTVYYITNMPCEVAAAAIASFHPNTRVVGFTIDNAKHPHALLNAHIPKTTHLILLGSYWNNSLVNYLGTHSVRPHVFLYLLGNQLDSEIRRVLRDQEHSDVEIFSETSKFVYLGTNIFHGEENNIGFAEFIIRFFESLPELSRSFIALMKMHSEIVKMVDDRAFGRNIVQNQKLYSGLFNYPGFTDLSNFERFQKLFANDVPLDKVMTLGETILDCQLKMSLERVTTNSRTVYLKNGKRAVVTNAPELINLTHEQLKAKNPGTDLTITLGLKFSDTSSTDQISYSIRSYNPEINAAELAKLVDGDGDKTAAGGRVAIKIDFPF